MCGGFLFLVVGMPCHYRLLGELVMHNPVFEQNSYLSRVALFYIPYSWMHQDELSPGGSHLHSHITTITIISGMMHFITFNLVFVYLAFCSSSLLVISV